MVVDNIDHEARLARMEAKMDALHARIDDVVVTQMKDLSKRTREMETEVRKLREDQAREEGKKAGSRAVLAAILAGVSACGGIVGAGISKVF